MSRVRALHATEHRRLRPHVGAFVRPIDLARAGTAVRHLARVSRPSVDVEKVRPSVERVVFGWGFINPMFALPQLYNVWILKHVSGISALTVGSALLMAALWTAYGLLGRQTVVWATSAIWVVVNAVTLVGLTVVAA